MPPTEPIPFQNRITGVAASRGEDDHAFSLPVGRETAEKAFSYSRLPMKTTNSSGSRIGWVGQCRLARRSEPRTG